MLKAVVHRADSPSLLMLGLSGENVTRLAAGEPILLDLGQLGLPPIHVVLSYGQTERVIAEEWERAGILPPGTTDRVPGP
jgi:hypothetical protein